MIKTTRATDPWMHTYICTYLQTIMILLRTPKLLKEKKYSYHFMQWHGKKLPPYSIFYLFP